MPFIEEIPESQEGREATGGVTGSYRIKIGDHYYQYKASILDKRFWNMRRRKAHDTDRENLGEVIAACIAEAALGGQHAPEVLTHYNHTTKHIDVLSKYLSNVKGTIDDYCAQSQEALTDINRRHVLVTVLGEHETKYPSFVTPVGWQMKPHTPAAKTLAEALAISAIIGDHDVNPGNMVVMAEKGELPEIGRIDFGHAFNDLLNAQSQLGGKIRDMENPIFDFFNRNNVAGVPTGSMSKVWRDYNGIVPSNVLGDALIKIGGEKQAALLTGVEKAKEEFNALFNKLSEENDEASKIHVLASFNAIHEAITGDKLERRDTPEATLNHFFGVIGGFILKNAENAILAGRMMKYQANLRQALSENITELDLETFIKTWEAQLAAEGLGDEAGHVICPWFKTKPTRTKVFRGTVEEYIMCEYHEAIELKYTETKEPTMLRKLLNCLLQLIDYVTGYFQRKQASGEDELNIEMQELNQQLPKTQAAIEEQLDDGYEAEKKY